MFGLGIFFVLVRLIFNTLVFITVATFITPYPTHKDPPALPVPKTVTTNCAVSGKYSSESVNLLIKFVNKNVKVDTIKYSIYFDCSA